MGPGMDNILKDEVFTGEDYAVWKSRIISLFKKKKFIHVLNKSVEEENFFLAPENESNEDKEIREAQLNLRIIQEESALELVQRRLDNKQLKLVLNLTSVKKIFVKFDMLYKRSGPQVCSHLREQLMNLKNHRFKNLSGLFDEYEQITREMEAANYELPKIEKIHYFLESIPKEYDQLVSYYEFMDDDMFMNLSFCEMKNKFYNAEIKFKNTGPAEQSEAIAFVAKRYNVKRV